MSTSATPPVFSGTRNLFGPEGYARLTSARVTIVGIGGVGSWAAEAVARAGVGQIELIDLDDICESNLNRQAHALSTTIGRNKVEVMADRIRSINPGARVAGHCSYYTPMTAERLIPADESPDFVIDAIDSIRHKAHLLARCVTLGIPVVTTGGAGGKRDLLQIKRADLAQTRGDALLQSLRKALRSDYGFPRKGGVLFGIPCYFSEEPVQPPQREDPGSPFKGRLSCDSGYGTLMTVTAAFGLAAANHVINHIAGRVADH